MGVGCHFLLHQCRKAKSESEVAHSCLTLSDPMDCSLPGSSVHGIFQARVLEWVAIAISTKFYSSILTEKISWTEEPGRLQSMGVAKSQARLSDFTFTFHFHALEKEMATHSSTLAWRIPGTGGAWWAAVYGVAQSRT